MAQAEPTGEGVLEPLSLPPSTHPLDVQRTSHELDYTTRKVLWYVERDSQPPTQDAGARAQKWPQRKEPLG
jgi:hypothetical protein